MNKAEKMALRLMKTHYLKTRGAYLFKNMPEYVFKKHKCSVCPVQPLSLHLGVNDNGVFELKPRQLV